MFGSTGQKRYDLRNRTTPAGYRDRTGGTAARDAEDGPARRDSVCGARHVSAPVDVWGPRFGKTTLMRSLLRKRFACPACRTARRKGGPAAVGKAARIIGSNFLLQRGIAQYMRNCFGKTRHNFSRIALRTAWGAISCPSHRRSAQRMLTLQKQTPRRAGAFEIAAVRSTAKGAALSAWPRPAPRGWRRQRTAGADGRSCIPDR